MWESYSGSQFLSQVARHVHYSYLANDHLTYTGQGCTNPICQVTRATKYCMVAPIFMGPRYGTSFVSLFWSLEFQG